LLLLLPGIAEILFFPFALWAHTSPHHTTLASGRV